MGREPYAYTDVKAWMTVEIGGKAEIIELSSVAVGFALDGIPTARVKLAVGSLPGGKGEAQVATAHRLASEMEYRAPAKIYTRLKGTRVKGTEEEKSWPNKDILLFDGYLTGPSYSRGTGAASLEYNLDHWLADLTVTSKLSRTLHPQSSNALIQSTMDMSAVGTMRSLGVSTDGDVLDDVWNGGIKAVLKALAQKDFINETKFKNSNHMGQQNKIAYEALKRMDDESKIDVGILALRDSIRRDIPSNFRENFGQSLNERVTANILDLSTGVTMWETIQSLRHQFQYTVVPNVESVTLVPDCPLVDVEELKVIHADAYSNMVTASAGRNTRLPLRGVALFARDAYHTMTPPPGSVEPEFVGLFEMTGEGDSPLSRGHLYAQEAPNWLSANTYNSFGDGSVEVNIPAYGKAPPTALDPDTGEPEGEEDEDPRAALTRTFSALGYGMAQSEYLRRVFSQRGCAIEGRFRLDIAPGTLVKLEVVGKNVPYVTAEDDPYLYGRVQQVNLSIDVAGARMGTQMQITHLHTAKERATKGLLIDQHPLYNDIWSGTELVKLEDDG